MIPGQFLTIAKPSEGFYKEKGSKFFAYAYPVQSEEEIKHFQEELRKEHNSARHHCYAWMIGAKRTHYRANDDGEPSNSAGKPILGQIESKNLTNVLVIVVRYFGGTKLGVGGLITAYKTAAAEALKNASLFTDVEREELTINFTYENTNAVMRIVNDLNLPIASQEFESSCSITLLVPKEMLEEVEGLLEKYSI